jgi:hypothetical protein
MKNLFSMLAIFLSLIASAQKNSLVKLKNGSAIRGEVLKNDTTGVSIETKDGSLWNFSAAEVLAIEESSINVNSTGFYNRTSLGILGGSEIGYSLRTVNGYSFNRHWEVGLGVGIDRFLWTPYIPIFAEGRYSLFTGATRPFVSAHAGYEMPLRNFEFNKGGLTTGLDLGVTHYFSKHLGISTSAGYRFALLKENSMWWDDFTTISQLNRYEIRLGLVFR